MSLRSISYGGGVQSTALVVLAAQKKIDFPLAIFSNTGEQAEPWTINYVRTIATPWAAERGVEIVEVKRRFADGRPYPSIDEYLLSPRYKGFPIPLYGSEAGKPGRRACTHSWKIEPVIKELVRRGASEANPATTALGISIDELQRSKSGQPDKEQIRTYPLLDLRLTRNDCEQIISAAGLPAPRKSSCDFCPFHSMKKWSVLRRDDPGQFERAGVIEDTVIAKRIASGKTPMYLTKTGRRLRDVVQEAQDALPGFTAEDIENDCDEGYCFT